MMPSLSEFTRLTRDLFVISSAEGDFVWTSEAWTEVLGWTEADLLGHPLLDLVHPADRARKRQAARQVLDGQPATGVRCRFAHRDGSWRWLEWDGRLAEDGRIYGLARDVTEAVEREEALSETAQLLTLAGELAQLGHWRFKHTDANVAWSDEVFRIHGRSLSEGHPLLANAIDYYHPDDQRDVERLVNSALERGVCFRMEKRIIRQDDGTTRWVRSIGNPEFNEDGEIVGVFGIFQDITEERLRRAALEELEQRYAMAFETTLAAHWDWDLRNNLVTWSRRWFDMLNTVPPSNVGPASWFFERVHPDDAEAVSAAVSDHLDGGARYDISFRCRPDSPEDTWIWIRATGEALRDDAGAPYRMIGAMLDITDTRGAVEALEAQVQRAEAASRAKSEFMANVSHEIRTPMNAILGLADLLAVSDLAPDQRRSLEDMTTASRTLLRLIDDLLDLAKAEVGHLDLAPAPFDVARLLSDVSRLHRGRAHERGLELQTQIGLPADTVLIGDAERLKQIISNLVGNALKFTDEGKVVISAELDDVPPGPPVLIIRVTDTGPGIPDDRLENMFQPFEQLDPSSTRRHGGVGLGLAICRELLSRMHGSVVASSSLGEGSQFVVSVPLPRGNLSPQAAPPPRVRLPGVPHVLLAEDNAINQRVAVAMLERIGCRVSVAPTGRHAVELAHEVRFDLVFMDVQMPDIDGIEATGQLRALGFRGPIVGLTAHAQAEDRARCLSAGMDDHLTKPISLDTLARALERHLGSDTDAGDQQIA